MLDLLRLAAETVLLGAACYLLVVGLAVWVARL
jgi:hypothetical protein